MKKIFHLLFFVIVLLFMKTAVFSSDVLVEDIFSDIDATYEYRDELQALYDRGMILPDASGRFKPESYLNRDEFVGISMEVICERCISPHTEYEFIERYQNRDIYFDIDSSNAYFYCVALADEQDYVRGYDAGVACQDGSSQVNQRPFCPVNKINKEEAIAVLLRNSNIFSISDNQNVISRINSGEISAPLGNDVYPQDGAGNAYTFYGYIEKALSYSITEYDTTGIPKTLHLLRPDANGNINPEEYVTREDFLRMSYIALKSNNCTPINEESIALELEVLEASCSMEAGECQAAELDSSKESYDFHANALTTCESGIDELRGYSWRFVNLSNGQQYFESGEYLDNYVFPSAGTWKIYSRVEDNCGQSSQVYNMIQYENESQQIIDVDIDMLSGDCRNPGASCESLSFPNGQDAGEYDFRGEVMSSCSLQPNTLSYSWQMLHPASDSRFSFSGDYIENFDFSLPGVWDVFLQVTDSCGNTASERDTIIINANEENEDWIFDVDIVVYDDDCSSTALNCTPLRFENDEDDGDDTFDFTLNSIASPGELESCIWNISHSQSSQYYSFSECYVEDFRFPSSGIWEIRALGTDSLGHESSDSIFYVVNTSDTGISVSIDLTPISGLASLKSDYEAIVSGGVPPYSYFWDFQTGEQSQSSQGEVLFPSQGLYSVVLQVVDSVGQEGSASLLVEVYDNPDVCLVDNDNDGISDCDDLCPLIRGSDQNNGCPLFEQSCDENCSCPVGYTCESSDPLTCGDKSCKPIEDTIGSCLYSPGSAAIFGSPVCNACPCLSQFDFYASVRKCDLVFPAITSPDGREMYSQGGIWQVR